MKFSDYALTSILIILGIVLTFFVAVGLKFGSLTVAVPMQNKQTEVVRSTNQYVTTHQTMLLTFTTQWHAVEVKRLEARGDKDLQLAYLDQETAIVNQMRQEASTLQPSQIPAGAASLLTTGQ